MRQLIVLFTFLFASNALASGCIECKLHGNCPFPSIRQLLNCTAEEQQLKEALGALQPEAAKNEWVNVAGGRIRHSAADSLQPRN